MQTDPVGYEDQMNLYAYVHNDPLNLVDPTGKASLTVSGVIGIGAVACSKSNACVRAVGSFIAGVIGATGGYFSESGADEYTGESASEGSSSGGEKPRFVGDGKGEVVDTETTPKGRYQQPDGGRTDVLQDDDHGAGRNHTHRPKTNTNPETGETFVNGLGEGTPVTEEDVDNITSGVAKPLPPRGR